MLTACSGGGKDTADTALTSAAPDYSEVQALFNRNCVNCHGAGGQMEALLLTDPESYDAIVGVASTAGMALIEPGDPDSSYLLHKISNTHLDVGGNGDPMPPPYGLAGTDLDLMSSWILSL
jgi:mono/diheme cytochrome c family protein